MADAASGARRDPAKLITIAAHIEFKIGSDDG
jgi:hypothetical protein